MKIARPLLVAYKTARRFVIALIGTTLLLFGVILIFIPGPALLVIPLGLAILALEFSWAKRWLVYMKERGWNSRHKDRKNESREAGK